MAKFYLTLLFIFILCIVNAQNKFLTPFEKNNNYTPTYHEVIAYYTELAKEFDKINLNAFGQTDAAYPLHEIIISNDQSFSPDPNKVVLLINNAIHPGEPCGVDASMMIAKDIATSKIKIPNFLTIIIIPFYNIGGGLNRGKYSRANQEGPEEHGFRGNANNLDLNRDFIKCDSKNAASFSQLFNKWNPHVLIDNHTSNGADYQYTMTLISTQKDKLAAPLSNYMTKQMLPFLYESMATKNWEICPYVYANGTPDNGIKGFLDLPRYSSGYAALHHTISFMPETHMLKPYKDRVASTYEFSVSMIDFLSTDQSKIIQLKKAAISVSLQKESFAINWELDKEKSDPFLFKGYEAFYIPSEVTTGKRLFYDRTKPYKKEIPFYNSYKASQYVAVPDQYYIPQSYESIIKRLAWNSVSMKKLERDTTITLEMYYIDHYETVNHPYEAHYLHYDVSVKSTTVTQKFYKGDFVIDTKQSKRKFISSVLEPSAPDSYFSWNFFDGILMQKENFSPYVFEDIAKRFLINHPEFKQKLEKKKSEDETFANNPNAQLNWIYQQTVHYEKTHRRYPIGRLFN